MCQVLFIFALIAQSCGAVCTLEVCFRCNAIVRLKLTYQQKYFPTWTYRCQRILKIQNCCSRFYGSRNSASG